jgi:hypothetical protein
MALLLISIQEFPDLQSNLDSIVKVLGSSYRKKIAPEPLRSRVPVFTASKNQSPASGQPLTFYSSFAPGLQTGGEKADALS